MPPQWLRPPGGRQRPLLVQAVTSTRARDRSAYPMRRAGALCPCGLPLLVLGTAVVAAAVGFLFLALTRRQPQVWVGHYRHGILREVAGHVPEAYSGDEIDGIRRSSAKVTNGITSVTTHELWVRPREGAEIPATDAYKGVARFIDALDRTFMRVRLVEMVENLSVFLALAAMMRRQSGGNRPRPDHPACENLHGGAVVRSGCEIDRR